MELPYCGESRLRSALNVAYSELKGVALLHVNRQPASLYEIYSRVRDSIGDTAFSRTTYKPLLNSSFPKCGFVEKLPGEVTRFRTTDDGEAYGKPVAAFALETAVHKGHSLYLALGDPAGNGGVGSPIRRVRMLRTLSDGPLNKSALAEAIGIPPQNIDGHIDALASLGYVKSVSRGNTAVVHYGLLPDADLDSVQLSPSWRVVAEDIYDSLFEDKKLSFTELHKKHPRVHNLLLRSVLKKLMDAEVIATDRWNDGKRSRIQLLKKGRSFLDEFIDPVERKVAMGVDEAVDSAYRRLLKEPKRWESVCTRAAQLYADASPRIRATA